jgi:hypothetical protein
VIPFRSTVITLAIAPLTGCLPPLVFDCSDGACDSDGDTSTGTVTAAPSTDPDDSDGPSSDSGTLDPSSGSSSSSEGDDDSSTGNVIPAMCEVNLASLGTFSDTDYYNVSNERLALRFDRLAQWHPSKLVAREVSEDNLLYEGLQNPERLAGVAHVGEGYSVQGAGLPENFVIVESGPALERVRIDWLIGSTVEGHVLYTVIADGRIVRDEYMHQLQPGDDGDSQISYLSLDPSRFDRVEWFGASEGNYEIADPAPTDPGRVTFFGSESQEATTLCAQGQGSVVAFAPYPFANPAAMGIRGTHGETLGAGSESISLTFDWVQPDGTVGAGEYFAHTLTVVDAATENPCECAMVHAAAFQAPPSLLVTGGGNIISFAPGDEDGDGFTQAGGFYSVGVDGSGVLTMHIESDPVPPSILIYLDPLALETIQNVTLGGADLVFGTDVLAQPSADMPGAMWLLVVGDLQPSNVLQIFYTP